MSDTHETTIVKAEPVALEQREHLHPLVVLAMRGDGVPDPAHLEKLMDLQERYEAREALKQFTAAMLRLKADLPSVIKHDRHVKYGEGRSATEYTHTSLARACAELTPILTSHGFTVSWVPETVGRSVRVSCRITHVAGHSEQTHLEAPPDTKGGKNDVQAIASTITYLERYTLLALLSIATEGETEPGESAGQPDPDAIDAQRSLRAMAWLKKRGIDRSAAEAHVQRKIDKWTAADLAELKKLGASKAQATTEEGGAS